MDRQMVQQVKMKVTLNGGIWKKINIMDTAIGLANPMAGVMIITDISIMMITKTREIINAPDIMEVAIADKSFTVSIQHRRHPNRP